ncbi:MAG: DUF5689 domain-containing protein [Bacteroidota bacterium]|nr:DUF5689 domain-containing protein [Bacteroidota bacterium]
MKKNLLKIVIAFFTVTTVNAQSNIAAARTAPLLSTVIIKGVVLNGPELGIIRYIQDNTAGISAYSSSVLSGVNRGDSIQVSGPLIEFKNLLEISTTTAGNPAPVSFTALGTGVIPTPQSLTAAQFNESVEGELLKFVNCTFTSGGSFATGTNYTLNVGSGGQIVARITSSVSNLVGTAIPTGAVDIVGVGSQFCSSPASGCTVGYQLLPRDLADINPTLVGLSENSIKSINLSVYPNPAFNQINFKVLANEVVSSTIVTDVLGKVVYSSKENNNVVSVENFSNGIYTIEVLTQNNRYNSKFTVSK